MIFPSSSGVLICPVGDKYSTVADHTSTEIHIELDIHTWAKWAFNTKKFQLIRYMDPGREVRDCERVAYDDDGTPFFTQDNIPFPENFYQDGSEASLESPVTSAGGMAVRAYGQFIPTKVTYIDEDEIETEQPAVATIYDGFSFYVLNGKFYIGLEWETEGEIELGENTLSIISDGSTAHKYTIVDLFYP